MQLRNVQFLDGASGDPLNVPVEIRRDGSVLLYPDEQAVEVAGEVHESGEFSLTVGGTKVCGSTVVVGPSMYLFVEGHGNDVETEHMYR